MSAAAERTDYERAAVLARQDFPGDRADDGEPEDGGLLAKTELDHARHGATQDNQAAIQLFVIRDGKMIGRDVFLLSAARATPAGSG